MDTAGPLCFNAATDRPDVQLMGRRLHYLSEAQTSGICFATERRPTLRLLLEFLSGRDHTS